MPPLALGSQGFAGLFHDGIKTSGVANGHFGERLAIKLDLGLFQAGDELAITQTPFANSGVDADDPEFAELALTHPTIAERERTGA